MVSDSEFRQRDECYIQVPVLGGPALLDDGEGDITGLYIGGGDIPWYAGYAAGSSGF